MLGTEVHWRDAMITNGSCPRVTLDPLLGIAEDARACRFFGHDLTFLACQVRVRSGPPRALARVQSQNRGGGGGSRTRHAPNERLQVRDQTIRLT